MCITVHSPQAQLTAYVFHNLTVVRLLARLACPVYQVVFGTVLSVSLLSELEKIPWLSNQFYDERCEPRCIASDTICKKESPPLLCFVDS